MHNRRWIAAAGLAACVAAGPARAQTSLDVTLLKHIDSYTAYAALWGWTSPGGRELVILGTDTGTSIVDATDAPNAAQIAFIPGVPSTWREMKAYDHYAYIVTEGNGGGMQIVDLAANPPALVGTYTTTFTRAHSITIQGHYAYVNGARMNNTQVGIRILDLTNPTNPVDVGGWNDFYTHDCQVRGNTLWAACISDNIVAVVDVTNKSAPLLLTSFTWQGNSAHNCDLTDDGRYLLTTDEVSGGHLHVFDVSDPFTPVEVAQWTANPNASIHNVHILGNKAYIAYYTEGLRVLDISDPEAPVQVGWYDTYPGASGGFNGNWEVYPYTANGNAYLSDIQTGLYVVRYQAASGSVSGDVRESGGGPLLPGAQVSLASGGATTTDGAGHYRIFGPAGPTTLVTSLFGFTPDTTDVSITLGSDTPQNVALVRLPGTSLGGTVRAAIGGAPLNGATVVLETSPLAATTSGAGAYNFPQVPFGNWTFTASRFGYAPLQHAVSLQQGPTPPPLDFDLAPAALALDFEPSASGWARTGGTATSGLWVWADPVGSGGGIVQPENDHSLAPGVRCWVTGNAASPGSGIGDQDVDNGTTVLTSATFDLSSVQNPVVSYWRWYSNDAGSSPGEDTLRVDISNNNGASWVAIERLGQSAAQWVQVTVPVANLLAPTNQMRMRFIAEDLSGGSVVEAAIDDFSAYAGPMAPVDAPPAAAHATRLYANVPNPFNATTTLRFEIASPGEATIQIFDVRGRRVRTLLAGPQPGGFQQRVWDGTDDGGRTVASGTYLVRLRAGPVVATRRLQLVK
jgi:choice-of-anchor B domain-containing protein